MSILKLGWATRDITMEGPVEIPGQAHARVSRGVLDPVTATALVVDDGNDCVIFVSFDAGKVEYPIRDGMRAKIQAVRPDIPVEKILANGTHIHTGPCTDQPDGYFQTPGENPERIPLNMDIIHCDIYCDFLTSAAADMVIEAWDKRTAGGIAYGYGYAVVAHSRRVCYFDDLSLRPGVDKTNTFAVNGHAAMYGNTNDDMFSHYEAGADHFINLMYTFDAENNLTGAIVNVPCPSQNSEHEDYISADYWSDVRAAIRAKHGNIFILPQCAAAGDLSPRVLHYKQAQDRRFRLKYSETEIDPRVKNKTEMYTRKDIAERVAVAFDEVLSWAKKDIRTEAKIGHKVSTIHLDKYRITEDDLEYAKDGLRISRETRQYVETDNPLEDLYTNTRIISDRSRFLRVMQRYEDQKTETTLPMELHVLHIGDIAFASNRFELYMDFQHRIQARSPFEQTFIVQLAGPGSYLCTERAFEGRGYSAIVFSIQASPKGGQQLVEETVKQLKELYADAQ